MPDALWTLLVVLALGLALYLPVFLVQRRIAARKSARPPASVAAAGPRPAPSARAEGSLDPQARIAELEAELATERERSRALAESKALLAELCDRYERLIERLSPGLLVRPEPAAHRPGEAA